MLGVLLRVLLGSCWGCGWGLAGGLAGFSLDVSFVFAYHIVFLKFRQPLQRDLRSTKLHAWLSLGGLGSPKPDDTPSCPASADISVLGEGHDRSCHLLAGYLVSLEIP